MLGQSLFYKHKYLDINKITIFGQMILTSMAAFAAPACCWKTVPVYCNVADTLMMAPFVFLSSSTDAFVRLKVPDNMY
jgi:hypothetical protein